MSKFFGIFACLVIVALDAVAGLLGIKAEGAQNQVYTYYLMEISLLIVPKVAAPRKKENRRLPSNPSSKCKYFIFFF